MDTEQTSTDIVIVGAGPVGLVMGLAAARLGLQSVIVEGLTLDQIMTPGDDGREIALTHRSVGFLQTLGVWKMLPHRMLGRIDTAIVRNEDMADAISFSCSRTGKDRLAYMVPHHLIRTAAYKAVHVNDKIRIHANVRVDKLTCAADKAILKLSNDASVQARLAVAADGRFSTLRQMAGIDCEQRPFGRTMMVMRLRHEKSHGNTAYEWFQRERTLAMLPLAGRCSSAVLTVDDDEARKLSALDDMAYANMVADWFGRRYADMRPAGRRHAYPLVATYAARFHAPSFVLAGDAAVGMHPVTAHGFNFGLRGVETLAGLMENALKAGHDFAAVDVLQSYERRHLLATRPLYLATNMIATLYTRADLISVTLRRLVTRAGLRMGFVRDFIARRLTDAAA